MLNCGLVSVVAFAFGMLEILLLSLLSQLNVLNFM
jgi:hypothetical protein